MIRGSLSVTEDYEGCWHSVLFVFHRAFLEETALQDSRDTQGPR